MNASPTIRIRMAFPANFLWGAGTAAHQVEGDNRANDWWEWETDPNHPNAGPSGRACEHWTRYEADLDILAGLGLNSYRFSVEWSRVEPADGEFSEAALDHYRGVCEAARARGLEPVVTFHHFTTPAWVARLGGWCDRATADRFARFCETAAAHLNGTFQLACTINEPNVVAEFGYELGIFPPGLRDRTRKELATKTLIAGHRQAVAAIRRAAPGVRVGLALSINEWAALRGSEERMLELRRSMEDDFLEATRGDDFVGVQNYTRLHVGPGGIQGPPPGSRTTQTGFEFRPEALGAAVRRTAEVTGLPVLVTENGICTLDDAERIEYTQGALRSLEPCLAAGVELLGYLHWSALDSFEWVLGYWPKYGLIEVDHDTQVRTTRASGRWLGRVARANSVVPA
ncbi:MAG TPA: family 1 glycosylhydrolase [Candidatus Dormibacteraeota bacterium]|nr:family 1 glycosylhydrolase [Candidatus Dormibacteraeota bacterium]